MKMKSIATLTFATTVAFAALLVGAVATRAASLEALTGDPRLSKLTSVPIATASTAAFSRSTGPPVRSVLSVF